MACLLRPSRGVRKGRLSSLWEMRVDGGDLCDVKLKTEGTEALLPAHRELATGGDDKGVDHDILQAIIAHAYCIETRLPGDRVLELLVAADLFQLESLLTDCSTYLQDQLTPHTVLSTRAYAHLHSPRCWKLYKYCNEYILENFRFISVTDEFLETPLTDLVEIISNDCLRVTCEEEVYNAVKRWVYHDESGRGSTFQSLIQHIRLPFVSRQFLTTEVQNEKLMLNCQKYFTEAIHYKSAPEKRTELKDSARIHPRKPFGLNEVLLVVGGTNKMGSLATVDQYDCRTDIWSTITSTPVPRYGAAVCYHNGSLFVAGGSNERDRFISRLDIYNMVEKKWTNAADLSIGRRYHSMVALFGLPTIIGGQTVDGVTASVDSYDPTSNTWSSTTIPPLNMPRMYHSAVELNGCVYVIGGHSGISRLASVECYNAKSGHYQWTSVAPLPEPRSVLGATAFTGGIYIAGGYNGETQHVSTVHYYNPITNEWISCPSMNCGRSAFGLIAYDGCLYACGGFNRTLSSTVECYIPGDQQWRTSIRMLNSRIHFSIVTT